MQFHAFNASQTANNAPLTSLSLARDACQFVLITKEHVSHNALTTTLINSTLILQIKFWFHIIKTTHVSRPKNL
jgi:hypothetical protein